MKSTPSLQVRAAGKGEAELLVYGTIGDSMFDESVSAAAVVAQLDALPKSTSKITVRINSFGGSVADGLAIYNSLKAHKAKKVVRIDGVAMSIASLIAMAGDDVQIPKTALFMVHAPWSGGYGNAKELRDKAEVLDKFAEAMLGAYVAKTGKSEDELRALLTDGTDHYYTGQEAKDFGFADTLLDEGGQDAAATKALASAPAWIQMAAMSASYRANNALSEVKMPEPEPEPEVKAAPEPVALPEAAPVAAAVVPSAALVEAEAKAAAALARLAEVEASLATERESREVAASVSFARDTFPNVPGTPEALGSALRVLAKADPKAHETLVAALKSANALIGDGEALQPKGLTATATADVDEPQAQIDRLVAAAKASNPALTIEAVKAKVYLANPKLVAAARGETAKD